MEYPNCPFTDVSWIFLTSKRMSVDIHQSFHQLRSSIFCFTLFIWFELDVNAKQLILDNKIMGHGPFWSHHRWQWPTVVPSVGKSWKAQRFSKAFQCSFQVTCLSFDIDLQFPAPDELAVCLREPFQFPAWVDLPERISCLELWQFQL